MAKRVTKVILTDKSWLYHKAMPLHKAWLRTTAAFMLLFVCIALSGCGKQLEDAFDADTAIMQMNSINASETATVRAKGFAYKLAIPGTTDFNADNITSEACLLLETGKDKPEALAYKHPYEKLYQASITKVLTALVCLDNVEDLSTEFQITKNSVITEAGSSSAYVRPGETLTVEQLLYGMLVPSGNDAAVAVAEATAGSVDEFVKLMNEKAIEIGATGSHFMNPNGLHDDDHYTTPYDIYLILNAAWQYPKFREIVGTSSYAVTYKDSNGIAKSQIWKGSNQFMTGERETPEGLTVLGGKTGTTKKAGYCLCMATENNATNNTYFSVVMKASGKSALYDDMTEIITKIH